MKIRIVGGSGSGKTYLGKELSQKYNISHFDLDEIVWDNTASSWGIKNSDELRANKLEDILKNDNWIIEGVYFGAWTEATFKNADQVIVLNPSVYLQHYRVIMRWFKRKFGIIPATKKETIKGLIDLIIWNHQYNKNELPKIQSKYQQQNNKVF